MAQSLKRINVNTAIYGILRLTTRITNNELCYKVTIMNLLKRSKIKQPKKPIIENYTASYLDKRSKGYHKIVMTSFIGMFGLMGVAYIFSSNAASPESTADTTNNNNLLIYVVIGIVAIAITVAAIFIINALRKNK